MGIGSKVEEWYHQNGRQLPWRDTYDPYQIWIAEVILQQTRIEQGVGYFYKFIERFPNVQELASAELDEVLKYWEGLGYYSRARNLHAAAGQLVDQYAGNFPEHHSELVKLKGIGPYTSRAIGSFAFANPTGVIDGNVLRVMSRVLGDSSPINQQKTRKNFQEIIDQWVEGQNSRAFNHGIMDIGATICTPRKPGCMICPLVGSCVAYDKGLTQLLPYKEKKLKRSQKYLQFFLPEPTIPKLPIRQRPKEGIWGGLWEIPNVEVDLELWKKKESSYGGNYLTEFKHILTHLDLHIQVFELKGIEKIDWGEVQFISKEEIPKFAFSKAVLKIFDKTVY
ncbi:MAG: A/G-specific adenine glycosylase [Bacteroidia bacterium]|nr:A/G-specific adenine glycosylase [Bacteroidia bacterium]